MFNNLQVPLAKFAVEIFVHRSPAKGIAPALKLN
jgi:hypothetical protein